MTSFHTDWKITHFYKNNFIRTRGWFLLKI